LIPSLTSVVNLEMTVVSSKDILLDLRQIHFHAALKIRIVLLETWISLLHLNSYTNCSSEPSPGIEIPMVSLIMRVDK